MLKSRVSKIAALLVSHWANDGYSVVLPTLLLVFSLEFGLTTVQATQLVSVFAAASAIVQLPVAIWGDYAGRTREILAGGLFVLSAAMLGWGWSTSYSWLLFFAFLGGLGFSGYHPFSMNLMTQQYGDKKGFALGIHNVSGTMGATMVPIIIGFFSYTWRLGLSLLAIPGLLSGLWILLSFDSFRNLNPGNKGMGIALRKTILNPMLLLLSIFGGVNQMIYLGSVTFIPLVFAYRYGWTPAATGLLIGAFHFSALVSQSLFGYLSDIMDRNRQLFALGIAVSVLCLMLFLAKSPIWSAILSVLIGAVVLAIRSPLVAKKADIVGPETRSAAIAVGFTLNSGLGALAPLIGGHLEILYSYQAVFLVFGLFSFLSLGFLLAMRHLEKKSAAASSPPLF
ncbi:MAG: MFS transporter [Bacillota bacterium]|nr:MFS transporter [Bacillota bacterium]